MKYQGIKSLFKYKPCDKKTTEALAEGKIYAPIVEQLNDPFENSIYLDDKELKKISYLALYNILENEENINLKNRTMNQLNTLLINNNIDINSIKMESSKKNKVFKNLASKVGVVSFSAEKDSLLIWSHYTAAHKGICLEFERNEKNDLGNDNLCFPVQYSSFIKDVNVDNINTNLYIEFFRYKCDIWAYEKEWRLITPNGKSLIKFPGKLLRIYFGLETKEEDINKIKGIFNNDVEYFKAEKQTNQYKIIFRALD